MSLFSKNQKAELSCLSAVGTDMHSHLIPEIDDGPKSYEESLDLINQLHNLGYTRLITTPHIMSDCYKNTPEIINNGLTMLRNIVKKENISIKIEAAAEYYIDFEFSEMLNNEPLLTFGNKYLLFELSFVNQPEALDKIIFNMQTLGYKPVIAHPERYIYWHNNFENYTKLKEKGVFFQLNINSLSREYALSVKKTSEKLIKNNMIDFIGSDVHNMHHIEIIKSILKNKYLIKLISSGRLLNNTV